MGILPREIYEIVPPQGDILEKEIDLHAFFEEIQFRSIKKVPQYTSSHLIVECKIGGVEEIDGIKYRA